MYYTEKTNVGADEIPIGILCVGANRRKYMKVTITLRGTLKKYFGEDKERVYEVPEGATCDEALQIAGLNYRETKPKFFISL